MRKLFLASYSVEGDPKGEITHYNLVAVNVDDGWDEVKERDWASIVFTEWWKRRHQPDIHSLIIHPAAVASDEEIQNVGKDARVNPLRAPANHSLEECFAELKFGRPAAAQQLLDRFIRDMNSPSSIVLDHGENKEANDYSRFWFGLVDESDPSWSFAGYGSSPSEAALNFVNGLKIPSDNWGPTNSTK